MTATKKRLSQSETPPMGSPVRHALPDMDTHSLSGPFSVPGSPSLRLSLTPLPSRGLPDDPSDFLFRADLTDEQLEQIQHHARLALAEAQAAVNLANRLVTEAEAEQDTDWSLAAIMQRARARAKGALARKQAADQELHDMMQRVVTDQMDRSLDQIRGIVDDAQTSARSRDARAHLCVTPLKKIKIKKKRRRRNRKEERKEEKKRKKGEKFEIMCDSEHVVLFRAPISHSLLFFLLFLFFFNFLFLFYLFIFGGW